MQATLSTAAQSRPPTEARSNLHVQGKDGENEAGDYEHVQDGRRPVKDRSE